MAQVDLTNSQVPGSSSYFFTSFEKSYVTPSQRKSILSILSSSESSLFDIVPENLSFLPSSFV